MNASEERFTEYGETSQLNTAHMTAQLPGKILMLVSHIRSCDLPQICCGITMQICCGQVAD